MYIITNPTRGNEVVYMCNEYVEHEDKLEIININRNEEERDVQFDQTPFFDIYIKHEVDELPENIEVNKKSYDGANVSDCPFYVIPDKTAKELEVELNECKQLLNEANETINTLGATVFNLQTQMLQGGS